MRLKTIRNRMSSNIRSLLGIKSPSKEFMKDLKYYIEPIDVEDNKADVTQVQLYLKTLANFSRIIDYLLENDYSESVVEEVPEFEEKGRRSE